MIEDIAKTSTGNDPQSTEVLAAPGQVVIDELYLTTAGQNFELKNFMVSFILYEDLFENFLTATLTLIDAAGLVADLRFNGTEFVTIKFRTRQSMVPIHRSFNVYAVKDRGPTNTDREQAYTLHLTSFESIINNNTVLSRKLSGRSDTVVENIFTNYLRYPRIANNDTANSTTALVITGGPHVSSVSFIPAYWSPLRCINWVAASAVGARGDAPNYLFFETNKSFMFTSIEDLIALQRDENNIFGTYVYSPSKHTIQNLSGFTYQFPELEKGYALVRSIGAFDMFDLIEGQDRGLYGSTVYTFDLLFKEQRRFVYDHYAGYEKFNHMNDYVIKGNTVSASKKRNTRPFPSGILNGVESKRVYRTKSYQTHPEQKDPEFQTWLPQRNSLLSQMSQSRIVIEVPGRSDVEVGKLVNFLYPKMRTDTQFEVDRDVSGLFMITAVKHALTRDEYSMTLELTKDSVMGD